MSRILNYLLYGLIWFAGLFPLPVLYRFADFMSFMLNHVVGYRRRVVMTNLRNSFPEKTGDELKEISKRYFRHFSDLVVETIRMVHMGKKEISRRFVYKNRELVESYYDQKKNLIFAGAHYNNWEWTHIFPALFRHDSIVVYMPVENKFFDKKFNAIRTRYGATLVTLQETMRKVLEFKKQEKIYIVGLIADQSPPPESDFWTTFLNQETAFYPGTEKIAVRLDMPVVYLHIEKVRRGYYEATFEKLVEEPKNTKPGEILEKFAKRLEQDIRHKPEYWLWTHKRWKHKRAGF